jgi:uncharacterized protein (UPF0210 family)
MMRLTKLFALLAVVLMNLPLVARAAEKPKVRAITAFVRIERPRYQAQVREALEMLRKAKAAFEAAGYEVQTIRMATQPFPEYIRGLQPEEALSFFRALDRLATQENLSVAIGPAMLRDENDPAMVDFLGEILAATTSLNGSVVVGDENGVYWNAVRASAALMKHLADTTPRSQGNFKFAASAMLSTDTPFFPAAYHLGPGKQFAIGLESANVVAEALTNQRDPEPARQAVATALGDHARAIERVARAIVVDTGWQYLGLDLSPAPLKDASIAAAFERFTGAPIGSPGSLIVAALLTQALRGIAVKQAGYNGLMLPVLEDSRLAQRWSEGALKLDDLLAYSAVCGTGLDVVPLPGDVTVRQLERIIGDVATLAVRLRKPLSVRLLPVAGKKAGERTDFDSPFLVNAVLQPLP